MCRVMFVSLSQSNDPFAAQLNALQKDAMGVGDLPVGMSQQFPK